MACKAFGMVHVSLLLRQLRVSMCPNVYIPKNMDWTHNSPFNRVSKGLMTQSCSSGTGSLSRLRSRTKVVTDQAFNRAESTPVRDRHIRCFNSTVCRNKKEEITLNFLNRDGETLTVKGKVGETFLDTVIDNDVDIDGFGACEGTLACSTCHLIFDENIYETLPEKLDEEEDMLDLAYGLEDTSRLGCQIVLTKEMDNIMVRVPEGINDARDV